MSNAPNRPSNRNRRPTRFSVIVAAGLVAVTMLTGCAGSSGSLHTSSSGVGGFPTNGPGGAPSLDPTLQKKIEKCLKAAGLSSDLPTGQPTGLPSGAPPSGAPTGTPPSGTPSGGFGGRFSDPAIQSALNACGITLPTRPTDAPQQTS